MPHERYLARQTFSAEIKPEAEEFAKSHGVTIVRLVNETGICAILAAQTYLGMLPEYQTNKMSVDAYNRNARIFTALIGTRKSMQQTLNVNESRIPDGTVVVALQQAQVLLGGCNRKGQFNGVHVDHILIASFREVSTECQNANVKFFKKYSDLDSILRRFYRRRRSSVFLTSSFDLVDSIEIFESVDYKVVLLVNLDTPIGGHTVVLVHPPRTDRWIRMCNSSVVLITSEDVKDDLNCLISAENVEVDSAVVVSVMMSVDDKWLGERREMDREKATKTLKKTLVGKTAKTNLVSDAAGSASDAAASASDADGPALDADADGSSSDLEEGDEDDKENDELQELPKPILPVSEIEVKEEGDFIVAYWLLNNGARHRKWRLRKTWKCTGGRACCAKAPFQGDPFTVDGQNRLRLYLSGWHIRKKCVKHISSGVQEKAKKN